MRIAKWILVLCACIALFACGKVTQENFDKVKPGMSMQEVVAILGEPTRSDSINIGGISGTSATWESKGAEINVQFLNDKVQIKSFNKISNQSPQTDDSTS